MCDRRRRHSVPVQRIVRHSLGSVLIEYSILNKQASESLVTEKSPTAYGNLPGISVIFDAGILRIIPGSYTMTAAQVNSKEETVF